MPWRRNTGPAASAAKPPAAAFGLLEMERNDFQTHPRPGTCMHVQKELASAAAWHKTCQKRCAPGCKHPAACRPVPLVPASKCTVTRLCRYEENDEGVTVRFWRHMGGGDDPAGEEGEEVQVRAKVVVGADGAHSAVRRACLDDGPPQNGVRFLSGPQLSFARLTGAISPPGL